MGIVKWSLFLPDFYPGFWVGRELLLRLIVCHCLDESGVRGVANLK